MNKLLIYGALLFSFASQAQEKFTLTEAKIYALDHSFNVQNANLDVENAHHKVTETRGIGLPQVNLEGNFTHFLNIPTQVVSASFIDPNAPAGSTVSFRAGTDFSASGTLKASQILFNGSYLVGLQVSRFYVSLQETYATQTKEDALFSVIQAYETAAVAKENKAFVDSMVVTTEELLEKQKNYLDLGMITQEDIDQLQYSVLTAKNAQLNAELQLKNALTMLKLAMNYPIDQPIELADDPASLMQQTATFRAEQDIHQNLNYTLLSQQVQVSEYNLKNNKSANLPTLNAFFQHTYNGYRNEFDFFQSNQQWFPQTFYGIALNIPLFSGLQRHAKIQQSEVKLLQDQNSLKNYEQTLQAQEIQARNNLLSAQQKMELQEANLKLAGTIYQNALIREDIGKDNSIIVTQKYNQLMSAQTQYISAMIDVFNAKLNLDKLYNQIVPSSN